MTKGKYIVIEGPGGVGKASQIELLATALRQMSIPISIMHDPDSQNDVTSHAIRRITQNPQYPMNTRTEVLLYNAARSQYLEVVRDYTNRGITCLADRNYLTNLAIQYYGRGDLPDYDRINSIIDLAVGDMEPDLTIVLDAEVQTLRKRLGNNGRGERFDNLDDAFLERVRAGFLWEAKQRGLPVVYAINDKDEVFKEVWKLVAQTLSAPSASHPAAAQAGAPQSVAQIVAGRTDLIPDNPAGDHDKPKADAPMVAKDTNGALTATDAGQAYLQDIITNTDANVYAFTEKLSTTTIAAAMARLSRRGDDMRITLLDEFSQTSGNDEKLLQRIISAYGDDSVKQLVGQHVVVEGASNLLTKKLEWGRLAAYLEQPTRYIYFDKKDSAGRYRYYVPEYLDGKLKKQYTSQMDKLFDLYSELVHKLTAHVEQTSKTPTKERDGAWKAVARAQACDAARAVLPVAVQSTVGIFASGQALESLIMHLLSDPLPEAHATGQALLKECRKVLSVFLERVDISDRGVALQGYQAYTYEAVKEISQKYLKQNHATAQENVSLASYWPKNELDLVPDMLYAHSNLALTELESQVDSWPYQKKLDVFSTYIGERLNCRHRPGRALEKAHYSFDLICDFGIFSDLQRHRMVDDLQWQILSPRYGYDMPQLAEQAGLSDLVDQCFDISLGLHSALQAAGYELEAQYATLLGHKMRWKVTINAREAFHWIELRTSPQGHSAYRKLSQQMYEAIAGVHPLLASAMKFVN